MFAFYCVIVALEKFSFFRTLLLQIMINEEARNPCWASFDGRHQLEVFPGDRCVKIQSFLFGLIQWG